MNVLKIDIPVEDAKKLRGSLVAKFPNSEILKSGHENLVLIDKIVRNILEILEKSEKENLEE